MRAYAHGPILLAALLALVPACAPSRPAAPEPPPANPPAVAGTHPETRNEKPKADLYGDPPPAGAIARMGTAQFRHRSMVFCVAFSPDGKTLASGSGDTTIRLWDMATGKESKRFGGHQSQVVSVAFSPDGNTLASGSGDGEIRLWNVVTGTNLLKFREQNIVLYVAFSPDGKRLVAGGDVRTISLWNIATGKKLLTYEGHEDTICSVAFSPDGKTLASGGGDSTIRLWEVATGRELLKMKLPKLKGQNSWVRSVVFSPDGNRLASGGSDRSIHLWEVATGRELLTCEGHMDAVWSVTYSPDGKTLASGSGDSTIRLWESATGKEILNIEAQGGRVQSVAFSPDGRRLASGLEDPTIRICNLERCFPVNSGAAGSLDVLWRDLSGDDAPRAFSGIIAFGSGGRDAVRFLESKLRRSITDNDQKRQAQKAIDDLNHDSFDVREKAEKDLLSLGEVAEPEIREAVEKTASAEMKVRGTRILEVLQRTFPLFPGEPLRRWRAIQVLERIGSKEAREVLEMLEKESPSLRERREAKAALERLSRPKG